MLAPMKSARQQVEWRETGKKPLSNIAETYVTEVAARRRGSVPTRTRATLRASRGAKQSNRTDQLTTLGPRPGLPRTALTPRRRASSLAHSSSPVSLRELALQTASHKSVRGPQQSPPTHIAASSARTSALRYSCASSPQSSRPALPEAQRGTPPPRERRKGLLPKSNANNETF